MWGAALLTECQLKYLRVSYRPNSDLSLSVLAGGGMLFCFLIDLCGFTGY